MKPFTSFCLTLACLTNTAFAASSGVSYTTDTTSTLVGSFLLDIADVDGVGTDIANFPHFHVDIFGNGHTPGDSSVFVSLGVDSLIHVEGEDKVFGYNSGTELYDPTGAPSTYPDRSGTFTSPFDGQTISYSYTNVGFTGPVISGDFSFEVVPEPSSALLALLGLPAMMRRRR